LLQTFTNDFMGVGSWKPVITLVFWLGIAILGTLAMVSAHLQGQRCNCLPRCCLAGTGGLTCLYLCFPRLQNILIAIVSSAYEEARKLVSPVLEGVCCEGCSSPAGSSLSQDLVAGTLHTCRMELLR
jgi:hypothetical protein